MLCSFALFINIVLALIVLSISTPPEDEVVVGADGSGKLSSKKQKKSAVRKSTKQKDLTLRTYYEANNVAITEG